jgi:hypothetical protein
MTYYQKRFKQSESDSKGKNKYSAKGTEYNGKWYHSKKEARYAEQLDWMLKAGEIQSWKGQHKIELKVNGQHITNYYMDFIVTDKHGGIEFHEVKGFETSLWQIKWRLLEATLNEVCKGAKMVLIK